MTGELREPRAYFMVCWENTDTGEVRSGTPTHDRQHLARLRRCVADLNAQSEEKQSPIVFYVRAAIQREGAAA
jgi:hypothetical protein